MKSVWVGVVVVGVGDRKNPGAVLCQTRQEYGSKGKKTDSMRNETGSGRKRTDKTETKYRQNRNNSTDSKEKHGEHRSKGRTDRRTR